MKDPVLEWERVKRPLMVVRAFAYLAGAVNMSLGGGGESLLVAAILAIQVPYSLVFLWMRERSAARSLAIADIVTLTVSSVLVGIEPTSVHMLFAADVLALSLILERRMAQLSLVCGVCAVATLYLVQPWTPFVDVPASVVARAELASGLIGLVVVGFVLSTLVRGVREAAVEQERRIEDGRRAAELQARFLAMVNHELRTPLTSIRGFAALLEQDLGSLGADEAREFVRAIAGQSEHLSRLVDDILVTLKIETGVMPMEHDPVDVEALFDFVACVVSPPASTIVEFDAGEVTVVRGDRDRLIQVLRNLVENACKYGGARVEVTAARADGHVVLAVSDDGPGIPEDALESVFGEYVQLPGPAQSGTAGFGLGLAICRRLVEAMGGRIEVSNRPQGGACFAVHLASMADDLSTAA